MLKPSLFYENISPKSSKRLAFVYAIILGSIGSIIGLIWTSFLVSALLPVFPQLEEFSELLTPSGASLIMMPLITTAQIFLITFYFHTLLAITNTPRKSVGTTFCVVCYAQSTAVLSLIPVVGSIAAIFWSLFMMTIGFNKVHRITMIRSIIINLLPLLILGFIGILLAVGIAVVSSYI